MTDLNIIHKTTKTRDEIWQWVMEKEQIFRTKAQKEGFLVTPMRDENKIYAEGKGSHGEALIDDGMITVNIKIPIMFRFFKSQIESAIKGFLKEV